MIQLHGQIRVIRLYGKINLVPSEGSQGGPLQAKTVYPSHSEQIVTPDEDYYGLVAVTVKPVPRVPACVARVAEGISPAAMVESVCNLEILTSAAEAMTEGVGPEINIGVGISVMEEDPGRKPVIDISMADGSNMGFGGSVYKATYSGGTFANGKFVINGPGYLAIPTSFMAGPGPWTVAFTIDTYSLNYASAAYYNRVARGNNDVPSIFYTMSVSEFQAKLALNAANSSYVEAVDSSYVKTTSNGALLFTFPANEPTTFVFRNNGEYISLWVNGNEIMREAADRYSSDKYASRFCIGDDANTSYVMGYLECSMLKAWFLALSDEEITALN